MLKVNVECVADLTSLALPEMLGCRLGQVVNVASVPGDLVLPTRVLYAASKAFVHALSEGLYRELRGTSVFVTMVNPGAVKTQFQRAAMGLPLDRQPERKSGIPAEQVAGAILRVLRRPRKTIIYVPRYFQLLPVFMMLFGRLFDRFGRELTRRLLRNAGGLGKKL
jgi:short-subunit dehydrogenase